MTDTRTPAPTTRPSATSLDPASARTTGLLYLGLAVAGMLGFLVLRPVLVDPDPATTLVNLREHEGLARLRIACELALVGFQVVLALSFFRLFRPLGDALAGAIAVFGTLNAVAVMMSVAALATGLQVALDGGDAATVQALHDLSTHAWGVGNLFFGLWLVPMGLCVLRSRAMPRLLGQVLVVGGAGYVLSGFVMFLAPSASVVSEVLVVPASVGEFWMIGHLLVRAARPR